MFCCGEWTFWMLFRPFCGVMYGWVMRIACVACIYIRAYIIISTCVRAKEMAAFVLRYRHLYAVDSLSLYTTMTTLYIAPSLLLCPFCFFLASNSYLCSIKWACFCIAFSPILYPKRGEITIFGRCNLNLIEMQKQCNFSLNE